jgi:type III pantothenate kinase
MILCLDAGNTRLKWGLRDGASWLRQEALDYAVLTSLASRLPQRPTQIVACNVAGETIARSIEALAGELGVTLRWLTSSAAACGVSNGYARPTQLGADRWAALIGARGQPSVRTRSATIVVIAGTATTIDQLDANGHFRGGLILPGLRLMRAALARDTANLPVAQGHYREIPDNTDDAIVSGTLHATLGAIERMRSALDASATVLLSGGAAAELAPHIPLPCHSVENLVLDGLAQYALHCAPGVSHH